MERNWSVSLLPRWAVGASGPHWARPVLVRWDDGRRLPGVCLGKERAGLRAVGRALLALRRLGAARAAAHATCSPGPTASFPAARGPAASCEISESYMLG